MYSFSNNDIPEWKKILIMKKRAGSSPAEDNIRNGICDPPKTVKIGSINVELRSVKAVEDSEEKNNNEAEPCSEDLRYGPGIVDRLRARFLNIGVKQQAKPVVRRFSSLENLPGIPYRVNTRRQNGFKSVKKAQSMETLSCTSPEQQIFPASRRPNNRIGAKAKILSKNVADENDKSPRLLNKRRLEYGKSVSAPNINEDELPKPDTVKHVKKIFESPLDSAKSTVSPRFRKIPSTTTPACNNSAIIESEAKTACAKDFCNVNNALKEINEISDNDLSVNRSREIAQETSDLLEENDSFKVTPERLPLELSHKQSDSLSQEETAGMVVAGEDPPKKDWPPQPTTSIVFDFRGRNDVEPHISLNPAPFGCRPAAPPTVNGLEDDWDEMDIGADLPAISGIVFAGENVKLGRSSFLETRNKKLSIQFDDKATSTFEYPSENASPTDFDSSTAMGSAANSRLSNYTPQVLSSGEVFVLGVSHLNHRATPAVHHTVRSPENNETREAITDVLIPADPDDTVGWSATETADILF